MNTLLRHLLAATTSIRGIVARGLESTQETERRALEAYLSEATTHAELEARERVWSRQGR